MSLLGIGVSLVGGFLGSRSSSKQAAAQNKAIEAQYKYDKELWQMKKDQLNANRDYQIQEIQKAAEQEGQIAAYKDASNLAQYN